MGPGHCDRARVECSCLRFSHRLYTYRGREDGQHYRRKDTDRIHAATSFGANTPAIIDGGDVAFYATYSEGADLTDVLGSDRKEMNQWQPSRRRE